MHLSIEYSPNGNITALHHGFGRVVSYTYGDGGLRDRVGSISINYFHNDGGVDGGSSEQRDLVTNVAWEPYGGLRKYRAEPEGVWVDYEKGTAASAPASRCATGALGESADQTERLRSLRVWSSEREVYRRTYTWRADEVERIDSCYLGGDGGSEYLSEVYAFDAGTGLGYDGTGRLKGGTSPTFTTRGGPFATRQYDYDSRGNIVAYKADDAVYDYTFDTSSSNRRDWVTSVATDSWNKLDFTHDRDGRITTLAGPVDSSGVPPTTTLNYVGVSPGSDTVMRGVTVSTGGGGSVAFNYYYDFQGRRLISEGPVSGTGYLYDLGHQLLESWSEDDYPNVMIEDFVWLDGRPIAAVRSLVHEEGEAEQLVHSEDETGVCSRNEDGVACGIYFLVTDHLGKPVLSLDSQGRISGVGEYDPYGAVNRVAMHVESKHPYAAKAEENEEIFTAQQRTIGGMTVRFRFHFPMIDTEQYCDLGTPAYDYVMAGGEELQGYARGDVWSHWSNGSVSGTQSTADVLWWPKLDGNQHPTDCENSTPWEYEGFVLREYEYQRHETGASPYFPPFRFPGQYWDPETDLNENWHRYYSPFIGRYLSPEPLLQEPSWVRDEAQGGGGFSKPMYAYASNNPLIYIDPTGLQEQTPDEKACMKEWEKRDAPEQAKCMDKLKSKDACLILKEARRINAFAYICRESKSDYLDRAFSPPDAGKPKLPRVPKPLPIQAPR